MGVNTMPEMPEMPETGIARKPAISRWRSCPPAFISSRRSCRKRSGSTGLPIHRDGWSLRRREDQGGDREGQRKLMLKKPVRGSQAAHRELDPAIRQLVPAVDLAHVRGPELLPPMLDGHVGTEYGKVGTEMRPEHESERQANHGPRFPS